MVGKRGRPNIKSILEALEKRIHILEEINGITPEQCAATESAGIAQIGEPIAGAA